MSDVLSPELAAVLAALIRVHARGGRATVGSVARERGRSRSMVHAQLEALRWHGLVAWESESAATLRPLVRPMAVGS